VIDEMNANRFGTRVGKDYVYGLEEEKQVVFQQARALFEWFAHQKVQVGTKTRGEAEGRTHLQDQVRDLARAPEEADVPEDHLRASTCVADPSTTTSGRASR
jgi:uncharacterized protein YgfB (UPF0149 family)